MFLTGYVHILGRSRRSVKASASSGITRREQIDSSSM